jgi:hypothetical protein
VEIRAQIGAVVVFAVVADVTEILPHAVDVGALIRPILVDVGRCGEGTTPRADQEPPASRPALTNRGTLRNLDAISLDLNGSVLHLVFASKGIDKVDDRLGARHL